MKRKYYTSPRILKVVEVLLEGDNLNTSPVQEVDIVGQEVQTYDFKGTDFNHDWGTSSFGDGSTWGTE
jgi:hypothetical protein